ncbi:hypothetical protein [Parendozoicomonas sp. Alg238-R29]|uniref:hypothetical protein n=1 Tax=Parendozoicomonas sp. Alg238-R29 TaxID=2993446 RepID=UPI00248DAE93|nr:hypothetical protein [Parendozoicomonas sp. Alg238-R29]
MQENKTSASFGSLLSALSFVILTLSVSAKADELGTPEVKNVIHNSGAVISGMLIRDKLNPDGPVSAINLFSLNTEHCGILDFEASLAGLTCTNCRTNSAVLKSCNIPRTNVGWHL